mgnify:CR=1 FL=1
MNTIAPLSTPLSFTARPVRVGEAAPLAPEGLSDRVSLAASAAPSSGAPVTPHEDHAWSGLGKAAAITAGVVGGAVIATVIAQAAGIGGMNLGSIVMNSLYHEGLPKAIGLNVLAGATDKVLLSAPVLGGVAGGIIGGIASQKKEVRERSEVPGSDLAQNKTSERGIGGIPRWTWSAVKDSVREAGENVHDGVDGIGDAKSFGAAVASGAKGGYAFGSRVGNVAGKTMGFVQGAYLGGLLAGMPFAFAPLTAIPVAIVGAWGISNAMNTAGGVLGGAVTGAGGAVAGAIGYGAKKIADAFHHGSKEPSQSGV